MDVGHVVIVTGSHGGEEDTFHKATLDPQAGIGQTFTTIVPYLLIPIPSTPLRVVSCDNRRPLLRGVDTNPPILIVQLQQKNTGEKYRNRSVGTF